MTTDILQAKAPKSTRKRGRPSGCDINKTLLIANILLKYPEGLWIRKIAKKANLHPNTVSNYINTVLSPLVEDIALGDDEKPILRVIRLKPSIYEKIQKGKSIQELIEFSQIIKNAGKLE
ncbi:MAG: hypothetical protein QXJ96_03605 [Candidatus Aenigmatarchaeota archaeon]|nr:hypothetical protein [Candidatus Aenigmarchaeota archaeon]